MEIKVKDSFIIDGELIVQNEIPPVKKSIYASIKKSSFWEDWKFFMLVGSLIKMIIKILPIVTVE